MKRALAERAKQSGLPNGVGPSTPMPEPPITSNSENLNEGQTSAIDDPVPMSLSSSIATHEGLKINEPSVSSQDALSSSPRPKKRLRESGVKLDEEEEDDSNASAFYLRHQNRALASELRMLKYQMSRLERERDYRRSQSSKAVQTLNSLQATWTQMEAALQQGQPPATDNGVTSEPSFARSTSGAPASTGSGTSVELIGALLQSLAKLGNTDWSKKKGRIRPDGDDGSDSDSDYDDADHSNLIDRDDAQQLDDLLRITDNVSKRANALQEWIWSLLQRVDPKATAGMSNDDSQTDAIQEIARLKAKNKTLKAKVKELAASRDDMSASDKRVRRGLYRLAAGRANLKEVLKAIVVSDEDKEAAAAWMEANPVAPAVVASTTDLPNLPSRKSEEGNDDSGENSMKLAALTKQVADLAEIANVRDEQIKKLLSEREDHLKQINGLLLSDNRQTSSSPTDEDIMRSEIYVDMKTKLSLNGRKVQELEEKVANVKLEWGKAVADAEEARKAMEEMRAKHLKRWKEFTEENPEISKEEDDIGLTNGKAKSEEIIQLQHKLKQALENVRQAEATRKTLEEAVAMNQNLQAKLDEVKSKYAALQASKVSSNSQDAPTNDSAPVGGSGSPTSAGITTPKTKSASSTGNGALPVDKSDKDMAKLHREYRKARKELAALAASKDAAKAKLSASEKEREQLNLANSRLLKQASERDDVNAKSLSTILHLKQLTDQITKEKENLEQQVKSSQQVTLASRLAANARERLSEEFEKARKELDEQKNLLEKKCLQTSRERDMLESMLAQQKAKLESLLKDADKARTRCDELASESTILQEERQAMMESLAVAKREAAEAAITSQSLLKDAGVDPSSLSGFTVDQLNTQVSVLKSRLACPVCNHRDKKCILLRCRHMFCKQCVDENIKNRSRKCPACGGRFDTKDVADVWL